jgi:NADPH:quinone reductase-like Zn-dependent oxidoreductase
VVPVSGVTALQGVRACGRVRDGHRRGRRRGSFAVQIAKALGARVTGVCNPANASLVRWSAG